MGMLWNIVEDAGHFLALVTCLAVCFYLLLHGGEEEDEEQQQQRQERDDRPKVATQQATRAIDEGVIQQGASPISEGVIQRNASPLNEGGIESMATTARERMDPPSYTMDVSEEYREQLLRYVLDTFPRNGFCPRILLLGAVSAGKSAFVNSVSSLVKGRYTQRAPVATNPDGITSQLRVYGMKSRAGETSFQLIDTPGVLETAGRGLHVEDIRSLVEGRIHPGYTFNPMDSIPMDSSYYCPAPTGRDHAHCVCLVVDGHAFSHAGLTLLKQLKRIVAIAQLKEVPVAMLATKMDLVESAAEVLLSQMSYSLGVPRNVVFPVTNYESQTLLSLEVDVQALYAIRKLLDFCEDYADKK